MNLNDTDTYLLNEDFFFLTGRCVSFSVRHRTFSGLCPHGSCGKLKRGLSGSASAGTGHLQIPQVLKYMVRCFPSFLLIK